MTVKVWCQTGRGTLDNWPTDRPDPRPYEDTLMTVGVAARPCRVLDPSTREWVEDPGKVETLFGLCTTDGYLTHMSYSDTYGPSWTESLDRIRSWGPERAYWYFDVGSNGRPLRIRLDLLETVMRVLGLPTK